MRRRVVLPALIVVYLAVVAYITLNPAPANPAGNPLLRSLLRALSQVPALAWVNYSVVEFTANILLFVPMGVLFTVLLGRWRWWLALGVGVVATLVIEFTQLFLPARVSDWRDLLANTLGTLIGIAIVFALPRSRR
ncbi:VanZ family protein [Leifsonia sp. fls2-241-R2A-40a]|uniref:VanZ family protein n=1 Tax=Leifsonia sp. fls2-241-R2A-40a TaxID=3040290 RepID=UPI00254CA21E|nr:VanZ family protein [Leifsonia sp. fls2-241-R2A-40a]